jgi:hypothetical protein
MVFSILIAHILCALGAINPHHAHFMRTSMHIRCFQSLLHVLVLSILVTHFLHAPSVIHPCCAHSMCIMCVGLVLSILVACALCALGVANPYCMLSVGT